MGFGGEVSVRKDQLPFSRSVCGEFWNCELFETTPKHEEGELARTELKARLNFMSGIVGAVAAHFHEFSVSDFDELPLPPLEPILADPALVIRDEDSLFEIVHRRACRDSRRFGLLEFVGFKFVPESGMSRSVEFISSSFDLLTFSIWSPRRFESHFDHPAIVVLRFR
jgi:hypothetical protein